MAGGKGTIIGTVFGTLIIAVMNNLLNLLGVPPFLREAFKGCHCNWSSFTSEKREQFLELGTTYYWERVHCHDKYWNNWLR